MCSEGSRAEGTKTSSITDEAMSEARKSSRRSGRGRVDGIGRGADGTLVGRYGGDAIVFSIFLLGVLGVITLGVASMLREGYDAGYPLSRVKCFCWGVRGERGLSSPLDPSREGRARRLSGRRDLSEERGGGRGARFVSDG